MISRSEFDAFETIILTGQIPHEDVPPLLEANPAFAEWYRDRIKDRMAPAARNLRS